MSPLRDAGDGATVTDTDDDPVRFAACGLFCDLQTGGLLAFDEIGIDGAVAVVPAVGRALGGAEVVGLGIGAADTADVRAVDEKLRYLGIGRSLRDEDGGRYACEGGEAGETAGRISGRCARDALCAGSQRMQDADARSTVLETRGGVASIVFESQA